MSVQFGDIAKLRKSITKPDACAGQPYIGLEHIAEGSLSLNGIGTAEDVTSAKLRFYSGDILLGKLRPYFRKLIKAKFDGICSTDIWVIRAYDKNVDQNFLFYLMASDSFIDPIVQRSEGTRMPRAKWDVAEQLEFLMPPLPEQRRIAHILGTLDDKIENNRKTAKTLEAMAQAIFKSWFVDFDPVRAKMAGESRENICKRLKLTPEILDLFPDRLVDSELGEIPEGWGVTPLDHMGNYLNGIAMQRFPSTGNDDALPVIKIAQLRSGCIDGADSASKRIGPQYVVHDGDILFSWSGSLECVLWSGGVGALNQHLFKVTSKIGIPRWLCYFCVHHFLDFFREVAAGKATTMGHIQRHHLSDVKLALPHLCVLSNMNESLGPVFEMIWKRLVEARALSVIRDTLLSKLISGEIRVPDIEPSLEQLTG